MNDILGGGFRPSEPGGVDTDRFSSVAATRRAGLPAFLNRHGSASTIAVSIAQARPHPIMVTITNAITVTIANAIMVAFADADAIGTDRHILG
jgi:hypothetical protein